MLLAFNKYSNVIATSKYKNDQLKSPLSRRYTAFSLRGTESEDYHQIGDSYVIPGGIRMRDHRFNVPLDYLNHESGQRTEVFVREMVKESADHLDLPCLLYLQGGPGFPAGRPRGEGGWLSRALQSHRVFLLDQRGTGNSSPISAHTLQDKTPQEQAQLLKLYRADSIVRDCEFIRSCLTKGKKWTVLGQSFGGFCLLTYLSFFSEGVEMALFTGGLAPVTRHIDEVYRSLARRQAKRNTLFYNRYPQAVQMVKRIIQYLEAHDIKMPSGGKLTPRRFLQLGIGLGSKTGMEDLYYLIEGAFISNHPDSDLTYSFLREIENSQSFDTNPIYAILHEPIYCEGIAPKWSAERILQEDDVRSSFDYKAALKTNQPVFFTGEMVFSWMFDGDFATLGVLKEAANILAEDASWGPLYNEEALKTCEVPCAAVVYYDDLYVERQFSEETASLIPGCKVWITNEYQHSGIRDDGYKIVDTLFRMANGSVQIPS